MPAYMTSAMPIICLHARAGVVEPHATVDGVIDLFRDAVPDFVHTGMDMAYAPSGAGIDGLTFEEAEARIRKLCRYTAAVHNLGAELEPVSKVS